MQELIDWFVSLKVGDGEFVSVDGCRVLVHEEATEMQKDRCPC